MAIVTTTELLVLTTVLLLPWCNGLDKELKESRDQVRFPAEQERHERTFMIFPGTEMWNKKRKNMSLLGSVQREIVSIAEAIVKFEPVTLIVSPNDFKEVSQMTSSKIDLLKLETDDVWARNTIPLFTTQTAYDTDRRGRNVSKTITVGIDFKANTEAMAQRLLWTLNIRRRTAKIVPDAGALETDGAGTLLVTRSSDTSDIESQLKLVLGVTKVIWLNAFNLHDIPDVPVDSIVRFVRPGRVIVSRPCKGCKAKDSVGWVKAVNETINVLNDTNTKDADGRNFSFVEILEPNPKNFKPVGKNFVYSYVNFYVVNGAVIMPKFGDTEADNAAQEIMKREFPGRKIVALEINGIVSSGGGIHCATRGLPSSGSDQMSTGIRFLFVSLSTALFSLFKFRF